MNKITVNKIYFTNYKVPVFHKNNTILTSYFLQFTPSEHTPLFMEHYKYYAKISQVMDNVNIRQMTQILLLMMDKRQEGKNSN